jgi:hypothetical protein
MMSTNLSEQIHELMERGVRPVAMADIESRAPARVTALRKAADRRGLPSAQDVPSTLREAGSRRQRKSSQLHGHPRPAGPGRVLTRRPGWPQLAAGTAAAVTAAAVTLALMLGSSPGRTGGPEVFPALPNPPVSAGGPPVVVSPGHHPSAASLAKAMLTAFNAAGDDLLYVTRDYFGSGHLVQTDRSWSWPAIPSPGQVQYNRDALSATPPGAPEATAPVKLTEDDGYTTVTPYPSRHGQKDLARLITVCYAGTGQTGCGWAQFNTPAGTWSQHTAAMPYFDFTPDPRGADLARQIARGQWRIIGHTQLRGQPAIKLAETRSGIYQGHPVYLWVSTASYLPLRMIWGPAGSETDNWYYLTPSKANLAHLHVPIPPGYPRSG